MDRNAIEATRRIREADPIVVGVGGAVLVALAASIRAVILGIGTGDLAQIGTGIVVSTGSTWILYALDPEILGRRPLPYQDRILEAYRSWAIDRADPDPVEDLIVVGEVVDVVAPDEVVGAVLPDSTKKIMIDRDAYVVVVDVDRDVNDVCDKLDKCVGEVELIVEDEDRIPEVGDEVVGEVEPARIPATPGYVETTVLEGTEGVLL
jgi:hypothetical protein